MNKKNYRPPYSPGRSMCQKLPAAVVLAGAVLLAGCNANRNELAEIPPPEVTVAKPVQQSLTIFLEQNGHTEPVEEAEVRSRVGGYIEKIKFRPGQKVKQGDELYLIEPDFYQAAQLSAKATVESAKAAIEVAKASHETAQAEVEKAESNFRREKRLLDSNAGSQATYESSMAARDSAIAQLAAAGAQIQAEEAKKLQADADLERAELDLRYCVVRAPLDGRVSKTDVKLGNLVDVGTMLSTVVDQGKIFANFSISDRKLIELVDSRPVTAEDRNTPEGWSKVPLFLRRDLASDPWVKGNLEYVDQQGIDESTGTFSMRGLFDNANGDLLPGMFVMIRLPVKTIEEAILIPERAVSRSQLGEFVLIVGADNTVERRQVSLGQRLDGWVRVIDGLEAEDSFVLEGLQRARPGKPVTPVQSDLKTERSPLPPVTLSTSPKE